MFLALLGGGLAVGVGLVFAFDASPRPPDTLLDDGGYPGIDAGHTVRPLEIDAGVLDAGVLDTGVDAMALDAALPDAGGAEPLPGNCTRPRDECAKEALDDARRLIEAGDLAGARRQVAIARQYDPGEDDIPEVEALIRAAEARQPPPPDPTPP